MKFTPRLPSKPEVEMIRRSIRRSRPIRSNFRLLRRLQLKGDRAFDCFQDLRLLKIFIIDFKFYHLIKDKNLKPLANFTNILRLFADFLYKKTSNPNSKNRKAAQKTFETKSCW